MSKQSSSFRLNRLERREAPRKNLGKPEGPPPITMEVYDDDGVDPQDFRYALAFFVCGSLALLILAIACVWGA